MIVRAALHNALLVASSSACPGTVMSGTFRVFGIHAAARLYDRMAMILCVPTVKMANFLTSQFDGKCACVALAQ